MKIWKEKTMFDWIKEKKKKVVTIVAAALLAAVGYFVLDVKPDVKAITTGDLSTIGQSLEDVPE
jgi:hypothetical protein